MENDEFGLDVVTELKGDAFVFEAIDKMRKIYGIPKQTDFF